jgi:hypothetical protein
LEKGNRPRFLVSTANPTICFILGHTFFHVAPGLFSWPFTGLFWTNFYDTQPLKETLNLFPNKWPILETMPAVAERMKNLQFANKTLEDLKLLCRFNEVADLMEALEGLPRDHPIREHPAYKAVRNRGYIRLPRMVSITPPAPEFGDADFSPEAIAKREKQGHAEAVKVLSGGPRDPCSA